MDASIIQCNPNPFHSSSTPIPINQPHSNLCLFKPFSPLPSIKYRPKLSRRRKPFPLVFASANPSGSGDFSWLRLSQSIRRGSERFLSKLGDSVKKETGFDFEEANVRVGEIVGRVREAAKKGEFEFDRFRSELVPEFIDWNEWDRWKDVKNWDRKRIGALVLYTFVVLFSCQRVYMVLRAPFIDRHRKELTEAYMEALVPEPTLANIRKFKKGLWRKTIPKGLKLKKFIEGPDGTDIQDSSYVGEDAWDDDPEPSLENVSGMIENDVKLNTEEKEVLREDLGVSGKNQESTGTWRERLQKWNEVLRREKLTEQLDSLNAKYVVEFDMKEVENSLRKDVMEKVTNTQGTRGLWISKRWWRYRPKLPYIYFLQKLDSSEVAAVVFAEDLKQIYVTMKEGFPLEYVVDIPLDPYLFETISNSGVEVDLLQKKLIHYFLKVVIALLPGILILWFIRESLLLLLVSTKRLKYRKYNEFFDEAYAKRLTRPGILTYQTKSMHDEVVLGGDVWDLLDELMMYLRNPMIYYEKRVAFVRGVLVAGPPGTGKTLFARTLANQSGVPFVQASGPEFAESEKGGSKRLNRLFSLARRNAPCFIFIDEIDAIAGRHCRKDPRRRKTFDTLLAQLDGEKERIGVDRFSPSQAVIFICATNRPQELDPEFIQPGRIDRHLYIGLPSEKQRVGIFYMHSAKVELAEDVDFQQVVFRTVGYSGADIRNIVNEAGIMSVRKGHSKIYQQDIIDVLDKLLLEGMGVLLTEEEQQKSEQSVSFEKKRLLAVHEAGHVLLAHLFPRFDVHAFSQLLPGGKETAMSVFYPREEMREYPTFGYLMMQMVVAHGGRCAERIIFGDDITDRGRDDLKKITMMAREMVISPTNARLGLTRLTRSYEVLKEKPQSRDSRLIRYRWDNPRVIPVDLTSEVAELFTRELTRYIEETEELAMKGLMDNRHILDMIARELLEKSRITGLDIGERIKGLSPTMFEDFAQPLPMDVDEDVPFPHNDRLTYQPLDVFPAPLHRC